MYKFRRDSDLRYSPRVSPFSENVDNHGAELHVRCASSAVIDNQWRPVVPKLIHTPICTSTFGTADLEFGTE